MHTLKYPVYNGILAENPSFYQRNPQWKIFNVAVSNYSKMLRSQNKCDQSNRIKKNKAARNENYGLVSWSCTNGNSSFGTYLVARVW